MKNAMHPAVIAGILIVIVAVVVGLFIKVGTAGPQTQGTDSMPPAVRKAFTSAGQNPALQKNP